VSRIKIPSGLTPLDCTVNLRINTLVVSCAARSVGFARQASVPQSWPARTVLDAVAKPYAEHRRRADIIASRLSGASSVVS